MTAISAADARSKLYGLIDQALSSHEPITIAGKRGNTVLISENEWRALRETIYLLSIPGMKESIRDGILQPINKCRKDIEW